MRTVVSFAVVFSLIAAVALVTTAKEAPLYQDAAQPVPARVADLLSRMSTPMKIAQLFAMEGSPKDDYPFENGLGSMHVTSLSARNDIQEKIMSSNPLKIPVAFFQEALHSGTPGGTVFPMPLTMGNSWNTTLVTAIYEAVANETRAGGANIAFAPVINLFMDPRFGRHQEGFSPNPVLTAHLATASVLGLQGSTTGNASTYLDQSHVASLGKHLAGYGGAMGGLNGSPTIADEREIRDVYMAPWRAFAKAGGRGAMPSHQTVLDVPCHANDWLVNKVFREELGFGSGLTISDCNDIDALMSFRVASNLTQASAKALIGGLDQDLQCGKSRAYWFDTVQEAIDLGYITEDVVDTAASHVLTMKFAAGLFENPMADPDMLDYVNNPQHQQIALEAAEQGIVMLQNNNNALPLDSNEQKIVVVGPQGGSNLDTINNILGSYTQYNNSVKVPSLPSEIQAHTGYNPSFSPGASIDDDDDSMIAAAVAIASEADIAIVAIGDSLKSCGEWNDRSSLALSGSQGALLANITALSNLKKVIVVVISGRPQTFEPVDITGVDAILYAGRPGQFGMTAVANVLFGKVNPGGKLASSWPRTVGHVGSGSSPWLQTVRGKWVANSRGTHDTDGRYYDNYVDDPLSPTPLFYFGHGMSYSTFEYSNLQVKSTSDPEHPVSVTFELANTGKVAGKEVTQVYAKDPISITSNIVRPWKRMVGFQPVYLDAGAKMTVSIDIQHDDIAFSDETMTFSVMSGEYTFSIGGSSVSDTLNGTVTLV